MASQPYIGYIAYTDFFFKVSIFLKHILLWSLSFCDPWVSVDLYSHEFSFLKIWPHCSKFWAFDDSIRCLPGFFLAPPTPISIHDPTITKILSCPTVSHFSQGNLLYLKQQNLYSFLLAFWLLLLVWSFELNFFKLIFNLWDNCLQNC